MFRNKLSDSSPSPGRREGDKLQLSQTMAGRVAVAAAATIAALVSVDLPQRLFKPSAPSILQYVPQPSLQSCGSVKSSENFSTMPHNRYPLYSNFATMPTPISANFAQPCHFMQQGVSNIAKLTSSFSYHGNSKIFVSASQSAWNMQFTNRLNSHEPRKGFRAFHHWHLPQEGSHSIPDSTEKKEPVVVVVLLGWLGSQQKHLKRYAEWYTCRGIHAITFTLPMKDVLTYSAGGKVEEHIDLLVDQLTIWLQQENKGSDIEKYVIFHTFSNTGWLSYGALLDRFSQVDPSLTHKIKGCVVDSAPVAEADPEVWASGFSAALLKKNSIAVKGALNSSELDVPKESKEVSKPKPAIAETALIALLKKFFDMYLNIPAVDRRLSNVLGILSTKQPQCPQLYFYSSADRVIPAESVEKFIEEQKKAGYDVRAFNFMFSPHVDHFRNFPDLYSSQLSSFLEDCIPSRLHQEESTVSS